MEDNTESNEIEQISDTWNKVLRDCKQIGFREGAFDGQEQTYQKSFDKGYERGFTNGFQLGQYKGNFMSKSESKTNIPENEYLKSTRKALCVICKDPKLLESCEKEIIKIQDVVIENVIKELKNDSTKIKGDQQ